MSMMAPAQSLEQRIEQVAIPLVRALNLDLVEVTCLGKGGGSCIRVTVDKEGGVGIADCEQLHHSLARALDVLDPIPQTYRIEVSSPGLARSLKHRNDYQRSLQKLIRIQFLDPYEGKSSVVGQLLAVSDEGIRVMVRGPSKKKVKDQQLDVAWEMITKCRLEVEF